MELRDIEIFLALAEELHFGRTAERLHITPSRVSADHRRGRGGLSRRRVMSAARSRSAAWARRAG